MAKQMIDVGLDDNEDLLISNGDLIMIESTAQHQRQLILNNNGDFKQTPLLCIGAFNYLNDEGFQGLMRKISIEFTKDGMDVKRIALENTGELNTDAYYA